MQKTRILIVEDETLTAVEVRDRLEHLGYDVCGVAMSGQEAVEKTADLKPDLVLMDIHLAEHMGGFNTARHIRERFNIPIIYLTSNTDEQILEKAKITEPFGYLLKPIEEKELRISIEISLYKHSIEKRLRENELRYRSLFEGAGDAIFILETEGGKAGLIVDANQSAANMHGYTLDELRGLYIMDLDAPDAAREAPRLIDRILNGEWIKQEINHRRKDNSIFPVEISAGLLVLDNHKYILAIDRDISERKKVEGLIRKSEEKYKNLVELTTDIIYITDNQGIQVYMNDESFRILGYTPEEIIGKPWTVLIHPDDWRSSSGMFKSMMEQHIDIFNFENRYLTKDGAVLNLIHNIRVLRDEEGTIAGVQGIARDITKRKNIEEELRKNFEMQSVFNELLSISLEKLSLKDILQQALDLIVSVSWLSLEAKGSIHLVEDEPDMLILRASKGLSVHLLEKCSRLPFGRCLCGRAALTQSVQYADCIDERHDISYAGMEPHGHYCVPFFSEGKVSGVMNLYINKDHPRDEKECRFLKAFANMLAGIVQRKRAEEERSMLILKLQDAFETVTRSQKEWRGTFDSITDLIFISDVNYAIIRANRAFAEYFGMTQRQVINRKCYELFNMTELIYSASPHTTSLRQQRMVQGEFVDQARGRTFLMTVSPYFSQDGELVGSIISCKDVTEEKQREMRLIMSERLASLGQMASGIAHEINNPLAAIAGCTEGLLKRVEQERFEPELFRNYLKIIGEEIIRCKNITTGMLSFVRKTTYDKQAVDITKILDKTLEIIGFQGRLKEVEVIKDFKEGMPDISGSEGELRQVFLAIITNALDVMEGRGQLTLETGIEMEKMFIRITDTGPGIPQEHITRVFEPFFTTKGERGGTGLGLAIASKIITNHGGSIDVFSETGKGAAFTITLPL